MDTSKTITHISLCAGYGGIDLGLKRAIPNLRTIAFSEIEAFACANLVSKMEAGLLDAAPIWTDLKTFPWASFRGCVDILSGGYPCQPFSAAGKRLGTDDPRHLWPFIADGIRILRPRMCFFENVEGHISLGLREVIEELEQIGYTTAWGIFSASECGAPHQRKRVFILAHSDDARLEGWHGAIVRECSSELPAGSGGASTWPSRPDEQQFAWEPPRVVCGLENAASQRSGSEGGDAVHKGRSTGEAGRACLSSDTGRTTGIAVANDQSAGGDDAVVANAERCGGKKSSTQSADLPPESGGGNDESVGNSASGQGDGRESRDVGEAASTGRRSNDAADGSGESLGYAEHSGLEGRAIPKNGGPEEPPQGCARKTKRPLGLHSDESSSFLGQTLKFNPYGDNVYAHENLSKKIRAREILFSVWREAVSQEIQWTAGGLQSFLAEKILQSQMQLDSFTQRICYFVWCIQTGHEAQGWGLRGMWVHETCGHSSQGQKPVEQLQRELGYAMCQLSYEITLARGQGSVEEKSILQGVREASERAWALSEALPEMEEVWRSSLDQAVWEKGCYIEAASIGNRTDELRLLGNGVVPATAERAFRILMSEFEKMP